MLLPILLTSSVVLTQAAITGEWNDANRDAYQPVVGRECTEEEEASSTPGLSFYVDVFREKIYAFDFRGCDGDGNAYSDIPTAEKNLPTDSAQCDGFNMTGWPEYGNSESDYKCPEGSSYLPYGEVSAVCCDDETAERYRKERQMMCPNGEEPLTHLVVYKNADDEIEKEENRRLLGRNCSHNFCPETHFCWQGEFEAFCCLTPPTTEVPSTEEVLTEDEEVQDIPETPAAYEANGDDRVQSMLMIGIGAVVFVALVGSIFVYRRRSNRRFAFDEKEIAALNP